MARKPRVEFEGALIMSSFGAITDAIFFAIKATAMAYLDRIEHYRERYRGKIYAYF